MCVCVCVCVCVRVRACVRVCVCVLQECARVKSFVQSVEWSLIDNMARHRATNTQAQKCTDATAKPHTNEAPVRKEIAGGMNP